MILKFLIIILLASINNGEEFSLNIFQMRDGYKHLIDQIKLIEPSYNAVILTKWIRQPLDHFDAEKKTSWNMRYFVNLDFWKKDGPIYIFLGGEAPASKSLLSTGTMYELAKETNGGMYVSEHRYYGKSKPVSGTSAKDFKFLSARQSLADVANLIRRIKSIFLFSKSKFVVVGGSYSGNLAAWMRMLYPDLVDAAIASSGPVLAKKDFYEYLEKVKENYEYYGGKDCINKIENIFKRFEKLFESTDGIDQLKDEENICPECDMTVPENKYIFFITKVSYYMSISQYGNTDAIRKHCMSLNDTNSDSRTFWNARQNCYDYSFNEMIKEYHKEENDWILAWTYQTCNEFGYFQTTNSNSQPFTKNVPLDLYNKICIALFGEEFNEERVDKGVEDVNNLYGGLSPNVTQVVFSNGDLDPWSTLSILEDLSYETPAVVIPRASHCRDLFSDKESDHEELKEARKHIKYLIKRWINASPYTFQF